MMVYDISGVSRCMREMGTRMSSSKRRTAKSMLVMRTWFFVSMRLGMAAAMWKTKDS